MAFFKKLLHKKKLKRRKHPYTRDDDEKKLQTEERDEFALTEDDWINQITVNVIQAKNLPKYDIGPAAKSDPYVKVFIGKEKPRRTKPVRRELNPVWNDRFVIGRVGLFKQLSDSILFEVYDRDKFTKDDLMGSCMLPILQDLKRNYSTPVEWVPLKNKKGEAITNKEGNPSQIQVQVRYILHADDANIRYYTHVMTMKIKKGKNLQSKELIGKSDPYVKVEWGAQLYRTKAANSTKNPTWDESVYLFMHEKYQNKFQLKFSVMDEDLGVDDHLGTGYVPASKLLNGCHKSKKKDHSFTIDVPLRVMPVTKDRGLHDFEKDKNFKVWGDVEIECSLTPKRQVEVGFYRALVDVFDKNNDGVIDRDEVDNMFASLDIPDADALDADTVFTKYDTDGDEKLDQDELVNMLQDSNFQGSELATQLLYIYLNGDLQEDFQKHLMTGFTQKPSPTSKVILIKDRGTGLLVQEFVPGYVWYALKLTYNFKLNRAIIQSKIAHKILLEMSENRGKKMDDKKSKNEIKGFIKQHNLNTNMLYKQVDSFATFNDFFARGMKVDQYRGIPENVAKDKHIILSPADCRLMVWDSILDSTKFWIKGDQFTVERLLGKAKQKIDYKKYSGGSFVIARLAPQDYHRWHYPLGGVVKNIVPIDGALYTVNPIAINKSINVYTDNKRCVLEIESRLPTIGSYIMVAVAAAMVGSYNLFSREAKDPTKSGPVPLKEGDEVERGEVAGEFRFGGSTILLLFQPNKCKFDDDLVRNVNNKFETLVTVRSRIGRVLVQ